MRNLLHSIEKTSMKTPWGMSDHISVEGIIDGHMILFVSTPSHGGYFVPTELLSRIPAEHQERALKISGSKNWYEEDCEWASVCLAFPVLFPPEAMEPARETIAWRSRVRY